MFRYLEPEFSFRSRFGYCNLMLVAAGEIIPTITGNPGGRRSSGTLLRPDGHVADQCRRPRDGGATTSPGRTPWSRARSFRSRIASLPLLRAGAINLVVKDSAQWAASSSTGHARRPTDRPGRSSTRREDQTLNPGPASRRQARVPGWAGCSGFMRALADRPRRRPDGMLSQTILVPEEKLGVVVLSNYDEQEFYADLPYHVIDAYLRT